MSDQPLGSIVVTQVAIIVRDIEQKAEAWAKVLGLPVPPIIITDPVDQAHTRFMGESTEARCKLAFFQLGQVALELIQPLGGPSTWQQHLDEHGEGLHHIAFEVKGIGRAIAAVAGHGVPLLQTGDYTGGRYAYVDGMEKLGAVLELLEND